MSALTLPGDIPGLLRRGSPVAATIGDLPGQRGIYVMRDAERADRVCVAVESLPGYGEILAWPLVAQCALDLTDATGRSHAAWWLGAQRGLAGGMAADLRRNVGGGVVLMVWAPGWRSSVWTSVEVPGLASLNPDDTRLLLDGSRWVDAEALRLVCLHVAGRAP